MAAMMTVEILQGALHIQWCEHEVGIRDQKNTTEFVCPSSLFLPLQDKAMAPQVFVHV